MENGGTNAAGSSSQDSTPALKNKPSESKFKQQKLPAWQPILTAGTVLPTFFIIGLIFIPIGVGLLITSNQVHELDRDYTDCKSNKYTEHTCAQILHNDTLRKELSIPSTYVCRCEVVFNIRTAWEGEVLLYYGLVNFYQNHRRYVKSRDDLQLLGKSANLKDVVKDCSPYKYNDSSESAAYAPCGAVANSLFTDKFTLRRTGTGGGQVPLEWRGIAWSTDKARKFNNPEDAQSCKAFDPQQPESADYLCWKKAFEGTVKPKQWSQPVWQLDPANPENNGFENEDLIVWMRTAALPTFRKLYRRITQKGAYKGRLPAGNYTVEIDYSYNVDTFGGRKKVILSTTSWLGAKNPFLGVAYIVVGGICIFLGFVFLIIHIKFGKSLAELANMSHG